MIFLHFFLHKVYSYVLELLYSIRHYSVFWNDRTISESLKGQRIRDYPHWKRGAWSHCLAVLHHQDRSGVSYAFPCPESIVFWYARPVIFIQEAIFLTCLVQRVRLNVCTSEWILHLFLPLAIKEDFITKVIRFSTSENLYFYFTDQRKWKGKNVELK